jgi:hypothetical protein
VYGGFVICKEKHGIALNEKFARQFFLRQVAENIKANR